MTCEEFNAMLDNYENLTDEEKLAMNEHAGVCGNCREELDFMLAIIHQLNTLPEIQTPPDFGAEVRKKLESETRGRVGALNLIRRNYRRYSTVAACLVLAVVIGANGKTLLDRLSPADTDGGAVVTTTGDVPAIPNETETARTEETADTEETAKQPAVSDSSEKTVKTVNVASTAAAAPSKPVSGKSASIQHIQNMSEAINQIDLNASDKAFEPVYDVNAAGTQSRSRMIADDSAGIAVMSLEGEASPKKETYTIARGVYRLPDPDIAKAELEASPMNEKTVLQIAEISDRNEVTIARGRYYVPADDGYIAIDDNNAIGVNSADAARAAELIKQYAEQVDDTYYLISSDSLSPMLEHMEGEGINYQNNVENSDNEKVSFKLIIE